MVVGVYQAGVEYPAGHVLDDIVLFRRHIRTEIADISAVNAAKAVSYHIKAGIGSGYYIAVFKKRIPYIIALLER